MSLLTPISKINSLYTLDYLTKTNENQYFELKGIGDEPIKATKIADELIGLLNADGGALIFGISDTHEIQNLYDLGDKLGKYRTLVHDFIEPTPYIQLEEIELDSGELIFIYHVEPDLERVFQRKDSETVFLRVADSNRKLDREQVKALEYDKQIRAFEDEYHDDFDEADFDYELLNFYKEAINYQGEALELLTKKYLASYKNGKILVKKSAILLFAKDPEKYIPSASIRYIRYEGNQALTNNVIKDVRFEGNIPNLINKVREFLKMSFKDYYFLNMQDGKFSKVMEYPEEAWLEAVVNALCHRSYNMQGNAVYIKHFDNKFQISNSGPLPAQVTVDNIKHERFARNPRIARVLEDLGFVRQLNEGVSRIYESMEKSMLSIPEYEERNNNIILVLRNKIRMHSKTIHPKVIDLLSKGWTEFNTTEKKILWLLFENQKAVIQDFEKEIKINTNSIRWYLNKFIKLNIIERISKKQRDKNAIYIFKQD